MSETVETLKAPFPWFGGKSRVAHLVWERFGGVPNYVEPFFGSGAVLLGRPHAPRTETVNDLDGYICNFWRAVSADPDAIAGFCDSPANENDLHARHAWLVARKADLVPRLEGDPEYFDAKIAGWWCWGICCWIGRGFCSGKGPWGMVDSDGTRQLLHLGSQGQGVHRQLLHLGDQGRGVHRKLLHLGDQGRGLLGWFEDLAARLRCVRVCCGDWSRICGPSPTVKLGVTGVFLDPPYGEAAERVTIYSEDSMTVAEDVRAWAVEHGDDRHMRIALCGYEGEHAMPGDWECVPWKTKGGYGSQGTGRGRENAGRERIWFSPHCLGAKQMEFLA